MLILSGLQVNAVGCQTLLPGDCYPSVLQHRATHCLLMIMD